MLFFITLNLVLDTLQLKIKSAKPKKTRGQRTQPRAPKCNFYSFTQLFQKGQNQRAENGNCAKKKVLYLFYLSTKIKVQIAVINCTYSIK
jgi:hypothetical protein